jgi:hypothetical protein
MVTGSKPACDKRFAVWLPMYPAPPVTKILVIFYEEAVQTFRCLTLRSGSGQRGVNVRVGKNQHSPFRLDLLALGYFKTYKLPVMLTRASNNYGLYQPTLDAE